ncbi:DEHA2E08404p [Debaryomyces hansenii CBS767]|uniref:DEHA2E08404p n=1 Tax=Debaryomyces hansenii (strain ATCC 36239 / CBS 767 / BCRC 21394 / JCM 1990 / NBRC 0083 / IGC 2968) TaxID=284592 RepID=Q6BQ47_DEBHA|nr:DEHA2E08404p [Debaryomyces hansenii CBS767]CAG87909.1 DEHA2E08404p [Debaryomyces hansenii CBS767]|eukprot:XP_459673.1 DEHA2E08404p [Debaryomyces hansenii CBS767]
MTSVLLNIGQNTLSDVKTPPIKFYFNSEGFIINVQYS